MTSKTLKNTDSQQVASMLPRTVFFVIPCYNEEEALPKTVNVLRKKIACLLEDEIISAKSKVIFVDDGSVDNTWETIEELHSREPMFAGVKFAHNEGHQNALYAGLMRALDDKCDAAISMDADLQDDISVIDRFIEEFNKGSQIVYGVRNSRATDTWFKRTSAGAFYRLMKNMGVDTVSNHADYRLMSLSALTALSKYSEVNLFLRGIVPTLGFETSKVYYERGVRVAGESKYPFKKMLSFAIQGITSFSVKPLMIPIFIGIISAVIGVAMLIYSVISVAQGRAVAGWASLMCSLWIIGGLVMLSLGIIGEYVGKIFMEVKRRPRYIVEKNI